MPKRRQIKRRRNRKRKAHLKQAKFLCRPAVLCYFKQLVEFRSSWTEPVIGVRSDSGIASASFLFWLCVAFRPHYTVSRSGGRMRKLRSANLFFILLLVLGLSWAVPAQDLPETTYDESEALPCESTPLVSEVIPPAAAPATQLVRISEHLQLAEPFRAAAVRINRTEARRSSEALVALALLCTLLC
jgi:hypothetical protein